MSTHACMILFYVRLVSWKTVRAYLAMQIFLSTRVLLLQGKAQSCCNVENATIEVHIPIIQTSSVNFLRKPLQDHPAVVGFGSQQHVRILFEELSCKAK